MISTNSWNKIHKNNKKILVKNDLGKESIVSFSINKSFRNYLKLKNINYTKDPITQDFIEEYFNFKKSENLSVKNNPTNITELDKKVIDSKVKELCGGSTPTKFFKNKLKEHYLSNTEPNIHYKDILKAELKNNTLSLELVEQRLDELMELDVSTLNRKFKMKEIDTSAFKTQEDINTCMNSKYVQKQMKNNEKKEKRKRREEENERRETQNKNENELKTKEKEEKPLILYSTVDYVDLYETRAVRHNVGGSYGKKGFRVYSGTSKSTQEWTLIGSGNFTFGGGKNYFVGGGQQRTIDTKKIIDITYFSNKAGIEVSVSNRQKSMRFMLPGRTIEDGQRFANALQRGEEQVNLTEHKSEGCYIATYVYGNYETSEVLILRKFRDEKLLTNSIGTLFVKFYYKTSPFLIKHFNSKLFKNTSKKILDYIIKKLN